MTNEEDRIPSPTLQEYFVDPRGSVPSYYERRQAKLAANTRSLEADLWDRLIAPQLALTNLDDISVLMIEDWRDSLLNAGVGPSSVERGLKIVKKVLQDAAHRGVIASNPAHGVSFPRKTKKVVVPLDPIEVERIAMQLAPEEAFLVRILGGTGMRPSELLGTGESNGVRWSDLIIPSRGPARLRVTSGKTGAVREILLLSPVLDDLILRRDQVSPGPDDFLVPSDLGERWDINRYRNWRERKWKKAVRRAGLNHQHRPYDLRHGFASLLIYEGRSLVYVARQMGNSVAVVSETYAHVFDRLESDGASMNASDALEAARQTVANERR